MGTISEKLTYLNDTKGLLKDKINNLGGSIDDNTTFRQYANQLQNVYDNLPKTEYQEGTEINLGKTIKGKLDFDNGVVGIGQTEQDGTPTPSTPIAINSVTGNQDVVVSGKNELNLENALNSKNSGVTTSNIKANSFDMTGKATWGNVGFLFGLNKNTDYIISAIFKSTTTAKTGMSALGTNVLNYTTSDLTSINSVVNTTLVANTETPINISFNSGSYDYIVIRFWNNGTATAFTNNETMTVTNIQLETGSTATTYEPYITPASYQLSLGDRKVYEGDYLWIDTSTGKKYHHHAMYNETLDGNNSQSVGWSSSLSSIFYTSTNIANIEPNTTLGKVYSNKLPNVARNVLSSVTQGIAINTTSNRILLKFDGVTDYNTEAKVRTYLTNNPYDVVYQLATETDEEITGTLAEQLEALYNAHSNNGTTILEVNGDLPLILKVRALKGGE